MLFTNEKKTSRENEESGLIRKSNKTFELAKPTKKENFQFASKKVFESVTSVSVETIKQRKTAIELIREEITNARERRFNYVNWKQNKTC